MGLQGEFVNIHIRTLLYRSQTHLFVMKRTNTTSRVSPSQRNPKSLVTPSAVSAFRASFERIFDPPGTCAQIIYLI